MCVDISAIVTNVKKIVERWKSVIKIKQRGPSFFLLIKKTTLLGIKIYPSPIKPEKKGKWYTQRLTEQPRTSSYSPAVIIFNLMKISSKCLFFFFKEYVHTCILKKIIHIVFSVLLTVAYF